MIYFQIPLTGRMIDTDAAYTAIKNQVGVNPNVDYVDVTETIEIKTSWRNIGDLKTLSRLLSKASGDPKIVVSNRDEMIEIYGTPAYKKDVANWASINEAREILRATADAPMETADTSNIDFDGEATDVTEAIMNANQGVCMARSHSDPDSLAAMLKNIQDGDIQMLFLEEFSTHLQKDLDDYLAGDDEDLPAPLKDRVEELKANFAGMDWEPILKTAREKGARIYPIDNEEARDCPAESGLFEEHRDTQMNAVVFKVMDAALKDPANKNKKYMAVVGAAHANTHAGGIPGVCQMFGIPAVRIDGNRAKLEKENKDLRGMPSKEEQIYMDLYLKEGLPKLEFGAGMAGTKALKIKAAEEAKKLAASGALPSFEEQVFVDQYVKAARKGLGANLTEPELRYAAQKKVKELHTTAALAPGVDVAALIPDPGTLDTEVTAAHNFNELKKFSNQIAGLREDINIAREAMVKSQQMIDQVDNTVPADDNERQELVKQKNRSQLSLQGKRDEITQLELDIQQKEQAFALAMASADPALIDFTDEKGRNLLHHAATMESKAPLKAVLDRCPRANLDQPDGDGNTPLHLCIKNRLDMGGADSNDKQNEAADYLLTQGADPDVRNKDGSTPAHLVAKTNNTKVLKTLFDGGADLTLQDGRGWTALDTTIAATSVEAEKLFYSENKAVPLQLGDPLSKVSTVDLLCKATLCEDPNDLPKVRAVYEKMYTDPALKPVLKLAALDASEPRDPPKKGSRIVIASGKTVSNLYLQPPGFKAPYPSGAFDEKAGVMMTGNRKGEAMQSDALFAGVIVHEMTHMSANIINCKGTKQGKPVPYEDGDDDTKDKYVAAIEEDAKNLHLLVPTSAVEERALDRLRTRLDEYKARKGEDGLLEECLVSVPQLIAEFGSEAIDKLAPNLSAFFKTTYAQKCNEVADSARFATARGALDDGPLAGLRPVPRAPLNLDDEYAATDSPALKVDDILKKIETDYITHYGTKTGTGIAYKTEDYTLGEKQKKELAKKLAAVKKGLSAVMTDKLVTMPTSNEDLRKLIHDMADLTRVKKEGDLQKLVTARANTWLVDAKCNYINNQIGKGLTLSDLELAESVVLNSELGAGAGQDFNVNTDKHVKMVQELHKGLVLMPPDKKNTQELQMDLMQRLVDKTTGSKAGGVYVKPKKKIGKRDPKHVSVDTGKTRSRWLDELEVIKAE